jgi:hypothetical protein
MHRPLEPIELDTASPEGSDDRRPRLRDGATFCIVVFLCVRLFLSVVAVLGVRDSFPPPGPTPGPAPGGVVGAAGVGDERPATSGLHNAIDGTVRWDAYWYLEIARHGYDPSGRDAAFFPGYPLLTRAIDEVTPLGEVGAALLVSNVAFLAALIVLHGLTRREYGEDVARRAVILLAIFPTSFFFLAPYSESLFLLFTLLTFWWCRQDRWFLAAAAAACAVATRTTGVLLVPCMLIDALDRRSHRTAFAGRVTASVAPLLGLAAYGLWWFERNGDLLAPVHAQDAWMRSLTLPPITLWNALRLGLEGIGDPRGIYWTADVVLMLWVLIPVVIAWRRLAPPFLAYATLGFLLPLTYPLPARPLLSVPRFVIVIFPAFWAMALLLESTSRRRVVYAASLAGFVIASLAFMNWGYLF